MPDFIGAVFPFLSKEAAAVYRRNQRNLEPIRYQRRVEQKKQKASGGPPLSDTQLRQMVPFDKEFVPQRSRWEILAEKNKKEKTARKAAAASSNSSTPQEPKVWLMES